MCNGKPEGFTVSREPGGNKLGELIASIAEGDV